ncbi:fatty acid desaturase [Delftia lacustris]|jgi:stearoyl-CoA desaturase (Delta-9 desaturase)|uniref:Aminotransferase n=1 Tax=Delftia tsuruhatensis TaxID=180282 RepID=A0ABM6EBU9_9BURK|nr:MULTISPECIES: fatty acid desaturase [Delftia]AOV04962.1 aminotransferase [Delftia tsuruhatensis]MDH0418429.1 fatty acid desaturase [Delftia tsuruhatensis]MDH2229666.1 fatty acid desaturase [Delftia tsuruhatensis]OJX10061.1 MAG: acyl-CoA desaturase [Delftia sp. 67-8]QFS64072.1 acyl-CoA desaturase [Delftia tsuruhatensis]
MSVDIASVWNIALDWMAHGLWQLSWWQLLLYALVTTHVTIAGVTIFLHRCQAHRSLDLGPVPSHFFRFWLWLGTGMVTKEWVAIHRKHHAKCETEDDPHSPQTRGLDTVMRQGAELYREEAKNAETLRKFGHGTPDDWIERHLYSRHSIWGPSLMLVINVLLFGAIGLTIWAVQMAWIPFWAAGVVNGLGHFWGYRNFEAQDASTNLVPWGLVIGGEELHNNHHTYPTSAKFSVKRYEFDVGWAYIRAMQAVGWAKVKKTPPRLVMGAIKPVADEKTLEAVIANRYEVMARYARGVRAAVQFELDALKQRKAQQADLSLLRTARRWLHRDADKVPAQAQDQLAQARAAHPVLDQMLVMREELRQLWLNTSLSREQLTAHLQAWCHRAEASGIAALKEFSVKLRAAHA